MLHKNLVKQLEKNGFEVNTFCRCSSDTISGYMSFGKVYMCSWYLRDDRAICVHVHRIGDKIDMISDYFPGFFAANIKEVIKYLNKQ